MPRRGFANTQPGVDTFTFAGHEEADRRAEQGWNSYVRGGQEAQQFDHAKIAEEHERLATELEQSKLLREAAHDKQMAENKKRMDVLGPKAFAELSGIKPSDEGSYDKLLQHGLDYSELYNGELADKRMQGIYDARLKAAQDADIKREQINARKAEQDATMQARQDVMNAHREDRDAAAKAQTESDALAREEAKKANLEPTELTLDGLKYTKSKAGPTDAIRVRYQKASNDAASAQKELDDTQAYIDDKKNVPDKTTMAGLITSRDAWKRAVEAHNSTKEALESVHPELAVVAQPPKQEEQVGPPPEMFQGKKPDNAPENPNLVTPPVAAPPVTDTAPVQIKGADDFHALPSGAHYIDPDGVHRIKK